MNQYKITQFVPEQIKELSAIIFDREVSGNGSFWWSLAILDQQQTGSVESQSFLLNVFYNSLTLEMRNLFISENYSQSLIYIDMPFMDVKKTERAVSQIDNYAKQDTAGLGVTSTRLIGVASVTIEVNNLVVGSQWGSLLFALLFTVFTLGLVFRDIRYAILTTTPVAFTVFMQWLVMDQGSVSLSLVTVMIGSILVGVGVDFSIHIANRVKELGGSIDAIRIACASTGMSLTEAVTVTIAGMFCAYYIPIPAIAPFIDVIIILLILAAISALILLPAIYSLLVKANISLTGGSNTMAKAAGLRRTLTREQGDIMDATLVMEVKMHGDNMVNYWLMKSEPDVYPWSQLVEDKSTHWDGVRNYQARNIMRDDMKIGDWVLFYHSNCKPPHVAGVAKGL